MKRATIFLCAVFLLFGLVQSANASQIWANGMTGPTSSGWLDADKDWTDDTLLCWAAGAANMLSWGGWDGGAGLTTEDEIFDDFENYWNDDEGSPQEGVRWWFNGQNGEQGTADWAQLTDTSHTGFYADPLFANNYTQSYGREINERLTQMGAYLNAGRSVVFRIDTTVDFTPNDPDDDDAYLAHWLTLWGVDAATGDLWFTDSDYNLNSLDHFQIDLSNGIFSYPTYDTIVRDWSINWVGGLLANTDGIEPTLRDPIPEPSTFILFGIGILGLARVGRRGR